MKTQIYSSAGGYCVDGAQACWPPELAAVAAIEATAAAEAAETEAEQQLLLLLANLTLASQPGSCLTWVRQRIHC